MGRVCRGFANQIWGGARGWEGISEVQTGIPLIALFQELAQYYCLGSEGSSLYFQFRNFMEIVSNILL